MTCALALLFAVPAGFAKSPAPATAAITILHFNDFHGQVAPVSVPAGQACGGLARLAAQAEIERATAKARGDAVFFFFDGDLFTGTAFSALFQGAPEFNVLSRLKLTAMTVGNHEWDFGQGVLMSRARHAKFPMVLANVTHTDPAHIFFKPWIELRAGELRVGVTGVTTADTPVTTAPGMTEGYTFLDPVQAVGEVLREHGKRWDFVVVLSHCGFEVDKRIADRLPQIGLIVGGHDHKVLEQPFVQNGVPIVQAGDRGRFLGEVRAELAKGKKPEVSGRLIPITSATPEDTAVRDLLAPYQEKETASMSEVVGALPVELDGDRVRLRSQECALGDLLADAMRAQAQADIGLVNGGTIRAGLPAGPVTGKDLMACLPYFDSVCTVRLTGAQVQALLDRCAAMPLEDAPGGFLQVSGLSVRYENGKALDVRIGDAALDPSRDYLVACSRFLLGGGDGLAEFKAGRDVRDWGVGLQELLRREIAKPDLKIPVPGRRIVRTEAAPLKKAA
jgi:2',3'-cyclic-nucleotide 2'-phosphodiesterase (5'-nucleotidase family)